MWIGIIVSAVVIKIIAWMFGIPLGLRFVAWLGVFGTIGMMLWVMSIGGR